MDPKNSSPRLCVAVPRCATIKSNKVLGQVMPHQRVVCPDKQRMRIPLRICPRKEIEDASCSPRRAQGCKPLPDSGLAFLAIARGWKGEEVRDLLFGRLLLALLTQKYSINVDGFVKTRRREGNLDGGEGGRILLGKARSDEGLDGRRGREMMMMDGWMSCQWY